MKFLKLLKPNKYCIKILWLLIPVIIIWRLFFNTTFSFFIITYILLNIWGEVLEIKDKFANKQ